MLSRNIRPATFDVRVSLGQVFRRGRIPRHLLAQDHSKSTQVDLTLAVTGFNTSRLYPARLPVWVDVFPPTVGWPGFLASFSLQFQAVGLMRWYSAFVSFAVFAVYGFTFLTYGLLAIFATTVCCFLQQR